MTVTNSAERTERATIDQKLIVRILKEPRQGRVTIKDSVCDGLSLVVGARTLTWFFLYRPRGYLADGAQHKQRRVNLGNHLTLTPAEARAKADALRDEVIQGADPIVEQRKAAQAAKLERARRTTLGDQAATYIEAELSSGSRHHYDEAGHLRRGIAELGLGDADPNEIALADIKRIIALHRDRPATARHRLGALSRLLDHLADEEIITANPAISIKKRNRPKPPAPRTRKPAAASVQLLWTKADDLAAVERDFLRSMILLPLRMSEMAELRPANWDDERGEVVMSHLQTKNGDPFRLAVPPKAAAIIRDRLKAMTADERTAQKRIFQLSTAKDAPMKAWSGLLKRIRAKSGVEEFAFHDLRRAFSTELAEHKIGHADLADALLNHRQSETKGGVRGIYQLASFSEPKKKVMAAWQRLVEHAIEHGKWPREAPAKPVRLKVVSAK